MRRVSNGGEYATRSRGVGRGRGRRSSANRRSLQHKRRGVRWSNRSKGNQKADACLPFRRPMLTCVLSRRVGVVEVALPGRASLGFGAGSSFGSRHRDGRWTAQVEAHALTTPSHLATPRGPGSSPARSPGWRRACTACRSCRRSRSWLSHRRRRPLLRARGLLGRIVDKIVLRRHRSSPAWCRRKRWRSIMRRVVLARAASGLPGAAPCLAGRCWSRLVLDVDLVLRAVVEAENTAG